uniref:Envelope polyprotein n=1 Tax=Caprine arthritis encephalitis virus TaxID=11660 RepID=C9DI73_CAEV|nr:envelope polyprotein [Caprine arthritis encephalitis virus]
MDKKDGKRTRTEEPPLREVWRQVMSEYRSRYPGKATRQGLWGMRLVVIIGIMGQLSSGAEYITLVSDPYGFKPIRDVTNVPVTCVTKNFTQWGCQPEGAYPDPEKEYRNISREILEEVYNKTWPWRTYHWPLWQMENMRDWAEQNLQNNKTRPEIEKLLAGEIRGRFCVPYPYAMIKCEEWCWYKARGKIQINCTRAVVVSCTHNMPLAGIKRVYWDKKDEKEMKFMNIKACNTSAMRCHDTKVNPGGCVEGYPIPVGTEIIPESFKDLREEKSPYGVIKDAAGKLDKPLTVRVWVRLANVTGWVNGTPPFWQHRINGSTGINGTRWYGTETLTHLGYNISSNPEAGICNKTGKIRIGNKEFNLVYAPSWNCSQNWTGYPVWHIFRHLDMTEDKTSRCMQRPQRKNITIGNNTVIGNCSAQKWDGCTCNRSGNWLRNSTTGNIMIVVCRENATLVGILEGEKNWTQVDEIMRKNCSSEEQCNGTGIEALRNIGGGTLGGVQNTNCTLPHRNETGHWTCKPRTKEGKTDSLYIGGKKLYERVKAQYSCESNLGGIDVMVHQQLMLQKYQIVQVRTYTYGVVEMPAEYAEPSRRRKKRDTSLARKKRGVGLVIVLVIMAIIAVAGASLGVANTVQQSETRTAVQELANATAIQQQVLEAAYAMVQHVAKGIRILEARVARVEALVDRMMLYQEIDCWHYHGYCVTSTRSEVANYINWTRYRDNCTWQEWEKEIEAHEGNLTQLIRQSALATHIAHRDASRIPDVWKALQQAFNWSGWFSWLKYLPWVIVGIIGIICIRIGACVLGICAQSYRQLKSLQYQIIELDLREKAIGCEGEEGGEDEAGSDGFANCVLEDSPSLIQIWRTQYQEWRRSPWATLEKARTLMVLPVTATEQWLRDCGRLGDRLKNKKKRVDCEGQESRPHWTET